MTELNIEVDGRTEVEGKIETVGNLNPGEIFCNSHGELVFNHEDAHMVLRSYFDIGPDRRKIPCAHLNSGNIYLFDPTKTVFKPKYAALYIDR